MFLCVCSCSGINFVLGALVFNVVPTIFELSLVTAILVSLGICLGGGVA